MAAAWISMRREGLMSMVRERPLVTTAELQAAMPGAPVYSELRALEREGRIQRVQFAPNRQCGWMAA